MEPSLSEDPRTLYYVPSSNRCVVLLAERSFDLRTRLLDAIASPFGGREGNIIPDSNRHCRCRWRQSLEDRFRRLWESLKTPPTHIGRYPVFHFIVEATPLADEQKVFWSGWCTERNSRHNDQLGWGVAEQTRSTIYDRVPEWTEKETSLCLRCLRQKHFMYNDYGHKTVCEHSQARVLDPPYSSMRLLGL